MVAVICVLLAMLGLMGTWPIFSGSGFWARFTSGSGEVLGIFQLPQTRVNIWFYPDGIILIVGSLVLFLSLFLVTKPWLLKARRVFIGLLWAFYGAEFIAAISSGAAFNLYVGLFFTFSCLTVAFIISFTNIGSQSALVSTQQGMPTSEMQTLKQTLVDLVASSRREVEWQIRSQDLQTARNVTIKRDTLKVGRDSRWADLLIPDEFNFVSRRHATFSPQMNGVIIQFRDAKYGMKINGKVYPPDSGSVYIPSNQLQVELVGGWGPHLNIDVRIVEEKVSAPKMVKNAASLVKERYQFARMQIKLITMLVLFVVVGVGAVSTNMTSAVMAELKSRQLALEKEKKQHIRTKKQLSSVKKKLDNVLASKNQLEKKLRNMGQELDKYADSLETLKKELEKKTTHYEAEAIVQIQEKANEIGKTLLNYVVFPGLIPSNKESYFLGTMWLGRVGQTLYLVTACHVVYPEKYEENISSRDIAEDNIYLVLNAEKNEYQKIPRSKFTCNTNNDWAYVNLGPIPDELKPYREIIPIIDPAYIDSVIAKGKFISWVGYPSGNATIGSIGMCTGIEANHYLLTTNPSYHGASGGPVYVIPDTPDEPIRAIGVISGVQFGQSAGRVAILPNLNNSTYASKN